MPERIIVALPAYNEDQNLGSLLDRIHDTLRAAGVDHSMVVIDDGSTDRTPEILRDRTTRLPLTVQTHSENQGLGGALRDALKHATASASAGDVIVTMDADE